jgi:hypothetical protein
MDQTLSLLSEIKLDVVMVGAEPLALLKAVLGFPPDRLSKAENIGFLDIAASKTELIIIRQGVLAFTRCFSMGGEAFTQAIAQKLEIDSDSAARLKRAISNEETVNDTLRSAALGAARPVLESMCTEILSCFRYFSSIFNRESVERLIMTGQEVGGLANPRLMKEQIGMPVTTWNPGLLDTGRQNEAPPSGLDPGFAPVIGLALESLKPSEHTVDFIPQEVFEQNQRRRSRFLRAAVMVLILLSMIVIQLISHNRKESLSTVRTLVKNRCNKIEEINVAVQTLYQEEKALKEKNALLLRIRPRIRISRILAEVANASGEGVTLKQFKLTKFGDVGVGGRYADGEGMAGDRHPSFRIRIEGLARSSDDVSAFVEGLARSNAFSSIRDEGFQDVELKNVALKLFSLTLSVRGEVEDEVF